MEREKTVCFTGHRAIPAARRPEVLLRLYSAVCRLILEGYDSFICGGAVGFDTEAALCVLELRKRFSHIRLVLALPCRDQTVKWESLEALSVYKRILGEADEVVYIQPFYTPGCMHERNRYMADSSSVCVSYLTSKRGGTYYTVNYAKSCGLRLINLGDEGEQIALG